MTTGSPTTQIEKRTPLSDNHVSSAASASLSAQFVTTSTITASKWLASVSYESSTPIASELLDNQQTNWPIYVGVGILALLIILVAAALIWVNLTKFNSKETKIIE